VVTQLRCTVDLSKAFDNVNLHRLLNTSKFSINNRTLVEYVLAFVKWSCVFSVLFDVIFGVRQSYRPFYLHFIRTTFGTTEN